MVIIIKQLLQLMGAGMLQLSKKLHAEGDTGERSRKGSFHKEKPLVNCDKNYVEVVTDLTEKSANMPKQIVQNKPLIEIGRKPYK